MKRIISIICLAVAAMSVSSCLISVTEDFSYMVLSEFSFEDQSTAEVSEILKFYREKGFNSETNLILTGSRSKCEKQAKQWFESCIAKIPETEFCALIKKGNYIRLNLSDGYKSDGETINVLASKEYQGTK